MKLDFDLVRQILLMVEEWPANQHGQSVYIPEYDENVVSEHLELLEQRGLITANFQYAGSGPNRIYAAWVQGLTWEGHDFLQNARNDEIWSKTKAIVKDKGGSVSFEIFKSLLTQATMNFFGLAP